MNNRQIVVRRNRKNKKSNNNIQDLAALAKRIQRYCESIMPFVLHRELSYTDANSVRNNPGNNFLVYSMRPNDLNDPDPLILSGSVSNFKEVMQFYANYRVDYTLIRWTVSNLEAFPLCCGIVFSQTNLTGVIASADDCESAFENDFKTEIKVISAKGGMDRASLFGGCHLAQLLGSKTQYDGDADYAGNGVATPNRPLWANFIVWSATGAALTNGWCNVTRMTFGSTFFGRLNNRT